jgi:hypothetical protein
MSDFGFRIKFRVANKIKSDQAEVELPVGGFSRPLKLGTLGPLEQSHHLEIEASGYPSEEEARVQGERLKDAMLVGGFLGNNPVDFGTENIEVSAMATLKVRVRFSEVKFSVQSPPELFARFINEGKDKTAVGLSESQRTAAKLLNDAAFLESNDARFLLRIAAVEALCPQGSTTPGFRRRMETLLKSIPADGSEEARAIREILNGTKNRQSVRSALRRKILALLGADDWNIFEELYDQRSRFLHEGAGAGTLADAAKQAFEIARRLLFADIAETGGGSLTAEGQIANEIYPTPKPSFTQRRKSYDLSAR